MQGMYNYLSGVYGVAAILIIIIIIIIIIITTTTTLLKEFIAGVHMRHNLYYNYHIQGVFVIYICLGTVAAAGTFLTVGEV